MATLRDVAQRAGVSVSTVSYVLRGDERFQAETVERVRRAAAELGYSANLSARILKSGRNGVIGVAVYGLAVCQPMRLAAAITRLAGERGLRTIVQETVNSREGELQALERVTSQLADGLVFSPSSVSAAEIKAYVGGRPMVWCEDFADEPLFDAVVTPSFEGAKAAVGHLMEIGCRRIGVLGADAGDSQKNTAFANQRLAGARAALEEVGLGLPDDSVVPCGWSYAEARKAVRQLAGYPMNPQTSETTPTTNNANSANSDNTNATRGIKADTATDLSHIFPFDGLFCLNDALAMGAARGLADLGVRVGPEVALVGFDGIEETAYTVPSISTIAIDYDDYARKILDLLTERIEHPTGDAPDSPATLPQRLVADFTLVRRESTMR